MKKLFTSLVAVFCAMAGMAQTLTFHMMGLPSKTVRHSIHGILMRFLRVLESLSSNRRLICQAMLLLTFM